MTENCNLIIAFFPLQPGRSDAQAVERILRTHPIRVDRIEHTEKGILVFAESTRCESLDLTRMREALISQGREVGLRVRLQRECLFRAMHSLSYL